MLEGVENAEILTDQEWLETIELPEGASVLEIIHIAIAVLPDGQTAFRMNRQGGADLWQQMGMVRYADEILVREFGG